MTLTNILRLTLPAPIARPTQPIQGNRQGPAAYPQTGCGAAFWWRRMKWFIVLSALGICACTGWNESSQPVAALPGQKQIDQSCTSSASHHLPSAKSEMEATATPAPTGRDDERTVVLVTKHGPLKATNVYVCRYNARTSTAVTKQILSEQR